MKGKDSIGRRQGIAEDEAWVLLSLSVTRVSLSHQSQPTPKPYPPLDIAIIDSIPPLVLSIPSAVQAALNSK
jgi:hypothetical protein